MERDVLEDLVVVLPPLIQSLEGLGFVSRYLNPPDFNRLMEAVGEPDGALRVARTRLETWSEEFAGLRTRIEGAMDDVLAAYDSLRTAPEQGDGMRPIFRALGRLPRAQEQLYPLAAGLPPLSRYFLDPRGRQNPAVQALLATPPAREDVGLFHEGGAPGARGAWSAYVPEYYSPDRAWPVIFALHGGAGNGRNFLWSWLREARSRGAILVAPTARGDTWALQGPDVDTPNLKEILAQVEAVWRIDPARRLLTGMSDGGTFSYVSGLEPDSPFTHLAPAASAFHPFMAQIADPDRLRGLPIHITHGTLDWMFPVDMAREAVRSLEAAGAAVTYRELDDLSHCYPREFNPQILDWMGVA